MDNQTLLMGHPTLQNCLHDMEQFQRSTQTSLLFWYPNYVCSPICHRAPCVHRSSCPQAHGNPRAFTSHMPGFKVCVTTPSSFHLPLKWVLWQVVLFWRFESNGVQYTTTFQALLKRIIKYLPGRHLLRSFQTARSSMLFHWHLSPHC